MLSILVSIWLHLFNSSLLTPASMASEPYLIIHQIQIEGNKKTNPGIILRELDISPGDTIAGTQVDQVLKRNRNKLFNTNLFNSVELVLQPNEFGYIDLVIQVSERWYIFPMIILELGDRNFNEWWNERGRDLRRINYGVRVVHKNVFGNGEEMRATAQFGFTRRFDLGYTIRYLDKAKKNGLGFLVSYATNKNMAFQTERNKLAFFNSDQIARTRVAGSVRFTHRNQFYNQHYVESSYHYNTIADTIARLNPAYFLNGRTSQQYLSLTYGFIHDRRDRVAYALHGHYVDAELSRSGFLPSDNLNRTALTARYALYQPFGKSRKLFWSATLQGMTSYPSVQPYVQNRALGFGYEYLRGYERYIIDGQHMGISKLTAKWEFFTHEFSFPRLPLKQFQKVPVSLYWIVFTDFGYVYDSQDKPGNSRLANKWLYSTGTGIDIVTYYNMVMRLNFATNRLGDRGLFFNFISEL